MLEWSEVTWILSAVVTLFFLITVRVVYVTTGRERLTELMSSIWAITCPEQNCAAIVGLVKVDSKMDVQDCSVQAHACCDRSCVAVVRRAALRHSFDKADLQVDHSVESERKDSRL